MTSRAPTASVAHRAPPAITTPSSTAKINHRRGGIVGLRLIDHRRRGIHSKAEWIDADTDTYPSTCGRGCRKRESAEDKRKNFFFHDRSLECSRAAKVTARGLAEFHFIALGAFLPSCAR